jgi:hypothetical protein
VRAPNRYSFVADSAVRRCRSKTKISHFGGVLVAIRWVFYRDRAGQCRWEVRGAGGPIATSGLFGSIEDCVAGARERGFTGPENPAIATSPAAVAAEDADHAKQARR